MIDRIRNVNRYAKLLYSQGLIKEVAQIIKNERIKQDLSHERIAEKASVHRTAVGHIESGARRPSLYVFIKMAKALGMKPSELLKQAEQNMNNGAATESVLA